jgi:predicted peroxiredoxin
MFLAADGTHLLNIKNVGQVVGHGTSDLKNHLDELKQNGIKFYVSGMSAKARGYDESLLDSFNAEFAIPDELLTLSTESDTVRCY